MKLIQEERSGMCCVVPPHSVCATDNWPVIACYYKQKSGAHSYFGLFSVRRHYFRLIPQFRSIIPCEVLLYIEVIFWD